MRRLAEGVPPHRHALRETGCSFSRDVSACNDSAISQTTVFRQSLARIFHAPLEVVPAKWPDTSSPAPDGFRRRPPPFPRCKSGGWAAPSCAGLTTGHNALEFGGDEAKQLLDRTAAGQVKDDASGRGFEKSPDLQKLIADRADL